ncbi:unnamed protein product [Oncorhynchus mykiss]|uniref:A-kinase anchor protein 7-like phosphoesterase domain-containing protein n=1 Tax=Oncorhynchus mykiss TaxID=8022 RepID=A0A060WAK4_ONCMY|nr:unnamed protein product [Oncorhynchus mykiss]
MPNIALCESHFSLTSSTVLPRDKNKLLAAALQILLCRGTEIQNQGISLNSSSLALQCEGAHRPCYQARGQFEEEAKERSVKALVMQRDSRLTRALVPVASLHITLLVTHLASQEEVNLAVCAVAQMKASLQDLLRGRELILPFHSIGHFRKVAFCRVGPGRDPCQTGPDRRMDRYHAPVSKPG